MMQRVKDTVEKRHIGILVAVCDVRLMIKEKKECYKKTIITPVDIDDRGIKDDKTNKMLFIGFENDKISIKHFQKLLQRQKL